MGDTTAWIVGAKEPVPPGDGHSDWYDDPARPGQRRYWDGACWTERTVSAKVVDQRYTTAEVHSILLGLLALLCAVLPIASWLAVVAIGPMSLMSARRAQRDMESRGRPREDATRAGWYLGIISIIVGAIASVVYIVFWSSIVSA